MGVHTHLGQEVFLLSLPDFSSKSKVAGNLGVSCSAGQQAEGLKAVLTYDWTISEVDLLIFNVQRGRKGRRGEGSNLSERPQRVNDN